RAECERRHPGIVDAATEVHGGQINATPSGNAGKRGAEGSIRKWNVQPGRDLAGGKRGAPVALNEVDDRHQPLATRTEQLHLRAINRQNRNGVSSGRSVANITDSGRAGTDIDG